MFRHIVVPLDGSQPAEGALPYAIEIARRFEADIMLIRNVDTVFATIPEHAGEASDPDSKLGLLVREGHGQDKRMRDAAEQYLKSKLAEVESSGVKGSYKLFIRAQFHSMMEFCQKAGADLVVMTTQGGGGIKRALLGSTADKAIRESKIPVLVIRPPG